MLKNYFDLELENNQFTTFNTIRELVEYCNEHYADRVFVIDSGREYTYGDVYSKIRKMAGAIAARQQNFGDIIALYADNNINYIIGAMAAMCIGYPCVAIPATTPIETLETLIAQYGIKTIMHTNSKTQAIQQCDTHLWQRRYKFQCFPIEFCSTFTQSILDDGWANVVLPDNVAITLFTSGTDGQPRGVNLSHRNILTGMRNGMLGFKEVGYEDDGQIYQLTIPLTHSFGLIRNLLCCMFTGSTLIISKNNKEIFADMQKYKPTRLITVPGFCDIILQMIKMGHTNITGNAFEYIVTGGAALSQTTIQGFQQLNIPIYNGYGMTETSNLFMGNAHPWEYQSNIGSLYPNSEYKIVDNELLVKGDNIFIGYFRENNQDTFDADGYFHTGDLVEFNEDTGLFNFIGRKKQLIVLSSGVNISPAKLEAYFKDRVPFVQECCVYSPDNVNLICEYYSPTIPQDLTLLYKLNDKLNEEKITAFVYRKEPFPKTAKLEIQRKKAND